MLLLNRARCSKFYQFANGIMFRNHSLCWIFTWQFSVERPGDLLRSFAVRDSSLCQLNDTLTVVDPHLCLLGAGIPPGTYIKAGLIRKLFLYDVSHSMKKSQCCWTACSSIVVVWGFRPARTTRTGCVSKTHMLWDHQCHKRSNHGTWRVLSAALTQRHVFLVLLLVYLKSQ